MNKKIILLLLLFSNSVVANETVVDEVLNKELNNLQREYALKALSVAVVKNGVLVYNDGVGDTVDGSKANGNTTYRIASVTKLFTSQAIMQLVERQKLKLEDNVSVYLEQFRGTDVTVRQLLQHTSGIEDVVKPERGEKTVHAKNAYLQQIVRHHNRDLTGHFSYSDTGYNVLGLIVENVTGRQFNEYVKQFILAPAKMEKTDFGVSPETQPTYQKKVIPAKDQRPFDRFFYPSEGLVASAHDLALWLRATTVSNSSIIHNSTLGAMLTPTVSTTWDGIRMALGWQIYQSEGDVIARHPGSVRGYRSLVLFYPEKKNGLIILSNASGTPRFKIAKRLTERLRSSGVWK